MEQLTFASPPNKFVRCDGDFNDRISALSDDLLVCILSSMPLKDAARTSVLSRRWQPLWHFSTGSFNFDAAKIIWNMKSERDATSMLKKERHRYIEWVNQVLDLHQASTIDELRVCFDLHVHSKHYIDKWIDFAFRKRVKKLELDFTHIDYYDDGVVYTFPQKYFSCDPFPPGIKFLTSLCLQNVNVTNKVLKSFLSNCPQLERLHVVNSETLTKLNVSGSSPSLKHLHISLCYRIKHITVSAPNLVSFEYFGMKSRLRLRYAPQLRNVFYGSQYHHRVTYGLHRISSFLCQLVTLKIRLSMDWGEYKLPKFPELSCLRHLTYEVWVVDGKNLLGLTSLIEASPALQKFKLECVLTEAGGKREVQKVEGYPNKNLKEVEVVGFLGGTSDTELIIYLLESAFNLEKLVIDPCPLSWRGTPWEFVETEQKQRARRSALQFRKTQANKGSVEFVIL